MVSWTPVPNHNLLCQTLAQELGVPALYLSSGLQNGVHNMVWDEYLLEWVRKQTKPILMVRLYGWNEPTWSLGVHQSFDNFLKQSPSGSWVRRPTGGRAIAHGADISFSFITNLSWVTQQSISDSYCVFSTWIRQCLDQWGLTLSSCDTASSRDYTRSAMCFETALPSDLKDGNGDKRVGAAQLRRHGGLLQHGSIFLDSPQGELSLLTPERYQAFEKVFLRFFQENELPLLSMAEADFLLQLDDGQKAAFRGLESDYFSSASGILARTSTN